MRHLFITLLVVLFGTLSPPVFSYEVLTHENLSEKALEASVLNRPGVLTDLGLKEVLKNEKQQAFPNSNRDSQSINDLFRTGANFEDNVTLTNLRPINHFFDPISGDALLPFIAKPSPSWALEDGGQINGFIGIFGVQKYSLADAREYLLKALTSPAESDRSKSFGLTFQTLGHIIHHVQDMAQPQHVRLDPHLKLSNADQPDWFFENSSGYEKYTLNNPGKLTPLFDLYPPVNAATDTKLTTARAFWHTGNGDGMGLAEFTNRNFVSAGTNFLSSDPARYQSPPFDPNNKQTPTVTQLCAEPNADCPANFLAYPDAVMTFYGTQVDDRYRPHSNAANPRASTESIFDQDLRAKNKTPVFSLNRFNFDTAHKFLIPRAVAYSAGLIDYFFRGKIDFVPDSNNVGKYTIKNLGAEDITGTFTLYYDAVDGKRYPVAGDSTTATWAGRTIAANGQLDNLSFTPPTNPAPKTPDEYMLVFKGNMGEEKAENGAVGAVIAKLIQQEGATDYVAMTMLNPVAYRGVVLGEIGVAAPSFGGGIAMTDTGDPCARFTHNTMRTKTYTHLTYGVISGIYRYSASNVSGGVFNTGPPCNMNFTYMLFGDVVETYSNYPLDPVFGEALPGFVKNGTISYSVSGNLRLNYVDSTSNTQVFNRSGHHDVESVVVASDSSAMGVEQQLVTNSFPGHLQYLMGSAAWSGGSKAWMFDYDEATDARLFHHKFNFTIPEDGIYPTPPITPPAYPGTDGMTADWNTDWSAGVTAFNLRKRNWLKKNSDEFVAALKTGFAPDAHGVTRSELKTRGLPPAWEYYIKADVDKKYDSYPKDQYNIFVGRHTRRAIQFSEVAFSDTVQSDTSANLIQAGVKVTKREVTLQYQIPVPQPDGSTAIEVRTAPVTGYLTQTVTRHNNARGDQLGLSRKDTYDTWYNRESTSLPSGVPSTITASYMKDRTTSRIGVVLNGDMQNGYSADSSIRTPGNPLTYALYTPPYPKTSSTVHADTPDFITTWHKDAKIEYLEDGVGASNVQNDSALYGVKQIEITPVGLIADGNGKAPAGTALGIFSTGEKGTQAEIYGTAVYNFDWQTGALMFNKWKPLLDAGGNELASKIINLPTGTVFPISNAIITYKGLHWPDVIAALKVRDESLPTATSPSDKLLYELIKAIKAE